MMERNLSKIGADRECNRDEVVEHCLEVTLTQLAVVAIVDALQTAETLDDARAFGAQEQPVHSEEPAHGGVQEEINHLVLSQDLVFGEGERVDTEQGFVVGCADMAFELGDDPWAPRPGCLQNRQSLVENLFIDHGPLLG